MTLWIVTIASLLIAAAAFAHSRRIARRVAILEEQYWQLKFEHGELKAKAVASEAKPNFVPLTGLRPPAPKAPAG